MDHETLRTTLQTLLRSGTTENPALNRLLDDYVRYHVVFVVLGGAFALALAALSVRLWRRRGPRGPAVLATAVSLFLGLALAANVSTVANPRPGFTSAVADLPTPSPGTAGARRQQAYATWAHSGRAARPALVRRAVHARLAWQRPKAIVCALLLAGCALLTTRLWRRRRRLAAWAATVACLILMAMVIGNAQGSVAPLTLTMLYG